jgi:cell division septation protein DedD
MAADRQEQKARMLMAQANYQESINQLRIAVAALEAAAAAPLEASLGAQEIYRLDLAKLETPPASPEPRQPTATAPAVPAAQAAGLQAVPDNTPPATIASAPLPGEAAPHAIQLGAFKSKKRARTFMKSLQKQYPGKTFETVAANSMYKVRSGQLSSREAAEAALQEFGGKGLIVRASSNH